LNPFDVFVRDLSAAVIREVAGGDDIIEHPGPFEAQACENLRKSGELPSRKIGRKWFSRKSDFLALIPAKGTVAPADAPDSVAFDAIRTALRRKSA
jgi:hypothetical protein